MFSKEDKRIIAARLEEVLLALRHPEMPKERPRFKLHVDGAESWSWADIVPNWTFEDQTAAAKPHRSYVPAVRCKCGGRLVAPGVCESCGRDYE